MSEHGKFPRKSKLAPICGLCGANLWPICIVTVKDWIIWAAGAVMLGLLLDWIVTAIP